MSNWNRFLVVQGFGTELPGLFASKCALMLQSCLCFNVLSGLKFALKCVRWFK